VENDSTEALLETKVLTQDIGSAKPPGGRHGIAGGGTDLGVIETFCTTSHFGQALPLEEEVAQSGGIGQLQHEDTLVPFRLQKRLSQLVGRVPADSDDDHEREL